MIQLEEVVEKESGLACQIALHTLGLPSNPPVICVHGLTRNATDFYPLAEHLAANYYVLMPDIPGRGQSPNLPAPALYNNLFYAALIAQLMRQKNIAKASWIGTSMGGMIGMLIAATQKDLIGKMLLNDVGHVIPAVALQRIKQYVGVDSTSDNYEELAEQVRKNLAPFGISDTSILERFVSASIKEEGGAYRLNYDPNIALPFAELADEDIDLSELWKLVDCPTLIFRGEHSDLLPKQVALDMIASKPNSELFEVADAGHAPSLTTDREVEKIKAWLAMSLRGA